MKTFIKEMRKIRTLFITTISVVLALVVLGMGYAFWRHTRVQVVRLAVIIAQDKYSDQRLYEGVMRKYELAAPLVTYDIKPFYYLAAQPASAATVLAAVQEWNPTALITAGALITKQSLAAMPAVPAVWVEPVTSKITGLSGAGVCAQPVPAATVPLLVYALKPGVSHVVIFYNAAGAKASLCMQRSTEVVAACAALGISATVVACPAMNAAVEYLYEPLRVADVLLTLEEDPLEEYGAVLADLCNKTTTTFFSGGLGGTTAGAAIAFAGHQQVLGKAAFSLVQQIVEQHAVASLMQPVVVNGHRQCVINGAVLAAQDMQPVHPATVRMRMLPHEEVRPYLLNLLIV